MRSILFSVLAVAVLVYPAVGQNRIVSTPGIDGMRFAIVVDAPVSSFIPQGDTIVVNGIDANQNQVPVKFKFDHVAPVRPNTPVFAAISPASGVTLAYLPVGLNQSVLLGMDPGTYGLDVFFTTTDQTPVSTTVDRVWLELAPPPPPAITSVLNAASFQSTISPGEMITIFGEHLAPTLGSTHFDVTGTYPSSLGDGSLNGNTTITFNGIAAPLLYVSQTQINALVPYEIAGQKNAQVVLTRYGQSTATLTLPVADTAPALFTVTQNGSGQAAAMNYPSYSYNSVENPAPKGSAIVLFGTGAGVWNPPTQTGAIALIPQKFTAQAVSLTIGGKPAKLIYTGASPYQVWGLLQVNAFVPDDVPSGVQPVVLTIGTNDNSQQKTTIAVQ